MATRRNRSSGRLTGALVLMLFLATLSCSGGPSSPDPGGTPTEIPISLAASSAPAGGRISILGIPEGTDLAGVYILVEEVSEETAARRLSTLTLISQPAEGPPEAIVPLHPADPVGGGPVQLSLVGNDISSSTVTLDIEALPEATVTIQDYVANLEALLTASLGVHGLTRETLRAADPLLLPAPQLPLWLAHEILDSPNNANNLRAAVDGQAPFFEGEEMGFDILEQMLTSANTINFLEAVVASVDSLETLDLDPDGPQARGIGLACIPAGNYGINSAGQLDRAMSMSRSAASNLEGATGQLLQDWSSLAGAAGVVPQLKGGATVVGAGLYIFQLTNQAASNLLPTSFDYGATEIEVLENDFEYNEDDTGGAWTKFKITGVSQGWSLETDVLGALMNVGGFDDAGGLDGVFNAAPGSFKAQLESYVINQAINLIIEEATAGAGLLEVCPGQWPDINAGDVFYSESEISFGNSFEMTSHTFFETREAGESELKIQTRGDRFGGTPPTSERATLTVVPLIVQINPSSATMEPSEILSFAATVENASDDRVTWTVPPPYQEVDLLDFGKIIVIQAPPASANWTDPVVLTARSQANTGSREGKIDSDPRDGSAVISTEADTVLVQVSPRYECIEPGETLQFEFEVFGTDDYELDWKIVEGWGTISQTGFYQSLSGGTSDTRISVEVVGHPGSIAYAEVRASGCTCAFSVNIGGGASEFLAGGDVAYQFLDFPDGFHFYTFFFETGAGAGNFSMSLGATEGGPAPRLGDLGIYPISVTYVPSGGSVAYISLPDGSATINITELTETHMEATISGTASQGEPPNEFSISFSGSIRAGNWAGAWPCE